MIPGLDPFVERVLDWTERAVSSSRNKKQQRAARVLADAGVLQAAMRTLTNVYVDAVGPVREFDSTWSAERRAQARASLMRLYDRRDVLPIVEQKRVALEETLRLSGGDPPVPDTATDLQALIRAATAFSILIAGDKSDLPWLWERMRALEPADEQEIRQRAWGAFAEFSHRRGTVDAADEAFGRLRTKTLQRFPSLPDPGWAVAIPA